MTRHLLYALLLLSSVTPVVAEDTAEPPKQGQKAADFELTSLDGKTVRLTDQLKNGPAVVVMLRGFPGYQCPLCTRQVGSLMKSAPDFAKHQAQVLLVYPGPGEDLQTRAKEFLRDTKLPTGFVLLTDPDYKLTNAWNLRWDAPRETAYPSTFVIGTDGVVNFALVSKTHGGRSRTKEVVEAVQSSAR